MSQETNNGSIIPGMRYRDAVAAIEWLCTTLGFSRHLVVPGPDGTIAHAQLTLGSGMIMLGSMRDDEYGQLVTTPQAVGGANTQAAYIVVAEIDAHYAHAKAVGAEIVTEIGDQEYGGRLYSVRDPEGHLWNVGSYDPWAES